MFLKGVVQPFWKKTQINFVAGLDKAFMSFSLALTVYKDGLSLHKKTEETGNKIQLHLLSFVYSKQKGG